MQEFTVEVFHKGIPQHLVDLTDSNPENACKRAKNAVFMLALEDGREFRLGDIEARISELDS